MSTHAEPTTETSVTISLAELAKLEEQRAREEDARRARSRESQARALREAAARQRVLEAAQREADTEARKVREQEDAREKAFVEARQKAAIEVARIEGEAKVRLDADNATRAHELAMLKAKSESGRRLRERILGATLGLVLAGGAAAAYRTSNHVSALQQETERLHQEQATSAKERDHARSAELATLDRRHAALRARPIAVRAKDVLATAEAARKAVDPGALDQQRLRSFGDALDALEARLGQLERVAALDRRYEDLATWAAERGMADAVVAARIAKAQAEGTDADDAKAQAFETALDALRGTLARATPARRTAERTLPPRPRSKGGCNDPHDPLCGFDGQPL